VIESCVYVLRQVDALGGLGDASVCEGEDLVEEVGVAVVLPDVEGVGEDALSEGDKSALLRKGGRAGSERRGRWGAAAVTSGWGSETWSAEERRERTCVRPAAPRRSALRARG
jgi:hypothetical protein